MKKFFISIQLAILIMAVGLPGAEAASSGGGSLTITPGVVATEARKPSEYCPDLLNSKIKDYLEQEEKKRRSPLRRMLDWRTDIAVLRVSRAMLKLTEAKNKNTWKQDVEDKLTERLKEKAPDHIKALDDLLVHIYADTATATPDMVKTMMALIAATAEDKADHRVDTADLVTVQQLLKNKSNGKESGSIYSAMMSQMRSIFPHRGWQGADQKAIERKLDKEMYSGTRPGFLTGYKSQKKKFIQDFIAKLPQLVAELEDTVCKDYFTIDDGANLKLCYIDTLTPLAEESRDAIAPILSLLKKAGFAPDKKTIKPILHAAGLHAKVTSCRIIRSEGKAQLEVIMDLTNLPRKSGAYWELIHGESRHGYENPGLEKELKDQKAVLDLGSEDELPTAVTLKDTAHHNRASIYNLGADRPLAFHEDKKEYNIDITICQDYKKPEPVPVSDKKPAAEIEDKDPELKPDEKKDIHKINLKVTDFTHKKGSWEIKCKLGGKDVEGDPVDCPKIAIEDAPAAEGKVHPIIVTIEYHEKVQHVIVNYKLEETEPADAKDKVTIAAHTFDVAALPVTEPAANLKRESRDEIEKEGKKLSHLKVAVQATGLKDPADLKGTWKIVCKAENKVLENCPTGDLVESVSTDKLPVVEFNVPYIVTPAGKIEIAFEKGEVEEYLQKLTITPLVEDIKEIAKPEAPPADEKITGTIEGVVGDNKKGVKLIDVTATLKLSKEVSGLRGKFNYTPGQKEETAQTDVKVHKTKFEKKDEAYDVVIKFAVASPEGKIESITDGKVTIPKYEEEKADDEGDKEDDDDDDEEDEDEDKKEETPAKPKPVPTSGRFGGGVPPFRPVQVDFSGPILVPGLW